MDLKNIETTDKMYVSPEGELCFQGPAQAQISIKGVLIGTGSVTITERSLSHVSRTKANNAETASFIQVLTGLDTGQLVELMASTAIEWLLNHTDADEGDVYRLVNMPLIVGWWKRHWYERDTLMIPNLVSSHNRLLKVLRTTIDQQESTRIAQLETMKKYISLHRMVFDQKLSHYRRLEDSYAKLW